MDSLPGNYPAGEIGVRAFDQHQFVTMPVLKHIDSAAFVVLFIEASETVYPKPMCACRVSRPLMEHTRFAVFPLRRDGRKIGDRTLSLQAMDCVNQPGFQHCLAEAEMKQTVLGRGSFLWSDVNSGIAQQVRDGETVAQFWSGQEPGKVPNGLIHDWIGAAFASATNIKKNLALIQDYDNHKNIYQPEVIASLVYC